MQFFLTKKAKTYFILDFFMTIDNKKSGLQGAQAPRITF